MTEALAPHPAPSFPPLLRGAPLAPGADPLHAAARAARAGTDAGLVVHAEAADRMAAAIVLAPEVPLGRALSVLLAIENGLADAIGALAPPEVAVHLDWPGGLRVNGARCGGFRAAASGSDPAAQPDWLVIGWEVSVRRAPGEPGHAPGETALAEEGCAGLGAVALLESASRHALSWIHRWETDGMGPVHESWRGRAWGMGEALADGGVFLGLDEWGGRLARTEAGTRLDPLTAILEAA